MGTPKQNSTRAENLKIHDSDLSIFVRQPPALQDNPQRHSLGQGLSGVPSISPNHIENYGKESGH